MRSLWNHLYSGYTSWQTDRQARSDFINLMADAANGQAPLPTAKLAYLILRRFILSDEKTLDFEVDGFGVRVSMGSEAMPPSLFVHITDLYVDYFNLEDEASEVALYSRKIEMSGVTHSLILEMYGELDPADSTALMRVIKT